LRDCIVSPGVFASIVARLCAFAAPSQHCLETAAAQRNVQRSLAGLLSDLNRKNAEKIAALVDVERLVIEAFIGTAPWAHRPLMTVLVGQVVEQLGAPDGVSAFAPSSFPKRGRHAGGVQRQWCSHRGKVDHCQGGVCMGDVSRHAHAWLDFRLSLPEAWGRAEQRRAECHVPPEVQYHTRHEQCREMLAAWGEQVPHGWGTGDDAWGRHTRLRQALRERGERYVLGGPCNTIIRDLAAPLPASHGRGRRPKAPWYSVRAWRHALAPDRWTRVTVRDGEKGPGEIEMVTRRVQTRLERKRTGPHEGLVVTRRPLTAEGALAGQSAPDAREQDAHYGYRYSLPPTGVAKRDLEVEEPARRELARVITAGTCMEASFQRGKSAVGMDEYQVRPWEGWHHHMALTLIAVWVLLRATHRGQPWTPALTLPPVRYGLSVLLLETFVTLGVSSICRHVQRQ
jgi:SRSO17 transposase